MKQSYLLFACGLLLLCACSKVEELDASAPGVDGAKVTFSMSAPETEVEVEPMTRAVTNYQNRMRNECKMLILKKIDSRWVVDGTHSVPIDPNVTQGLSMEIEKWPDGSSFTLELRPGDYRVVAVLNAAAAAWNSGLKPGVTVADEQDPSFPTPPLLTYRISDHWANTGYRDLGYEVFVAVTDFSVPKSTDLHASAMQPVPLRPQRRVGKFRLLLKDRSVPYSFNETAHNVRLVMTAQNLPFPEGIDALGGMYYSDPPMWQMGWCSWTWAYFYEPNRVSAPAGTRYQIPQTGSTVYSPFLFADPQGPGIEFTLSDIVMYGASEGYDYDTDEVFSRTLHANRITGIVFEATDMYDSTSRQKRVHVKEVAGEDPAALFDPYFEWNAKSYKTSKR